MYCNEKITRKPLPLGQLVLARALGPREQAHVPSGAPFVLAGIDALVRGEEAGDVFINTSSSSKLPNGYNKLESLARQAFPSVCNVSVQLIGPIHKLRRQ